MAKNLDVHLLLADHDSHEPVIGDALDGRSAARERPVAGPDAVDLLTGDAGELPDQRWGVVVPSGSVGDRLLERVHPLIARREQEQGAAVEVFRSSSSYTSDLSLRDAFEWHDLFVDDYRHLDRELPRYLLILGDLVQVPLAIQQALSATAGRMVGRLAFDRDDDYRAYADKVCRLEAGPTSDRGQAIFHTVHDRTPATRQGYDKLVQHLVNELRRSRGQGARVVDSGSRQPSPDELFAAVDASAEPAVLFTLSHGEGAPKEGWSSPEEQRRHQGTMSFGAGRRIDHQRLRARPFLPGGVWFMQACFGAGTPVRSPYLGWLERLAADGQDPAGVAQVLASQPLSGQPFVSHLAQTVLAHPDGPCAFIGHVDLAWAFSFRDPHDASGSRPGHFARMVDRILDGHRVGQGMREIVDYMVRTVVDLAARYAGGDPGDDRDDDEADERSLRWMIWQDLAGYILLGDPAVRLPLRRAAPAPTSPEPPRPGEHDALERAIAKVILRYDAETVAIEEQLDVDGKELERLAAAYRRAGLAGLAKERG